MRAVRTDARVAIDGALTEEAWLAAPAFEQFVQSYPRSGDAPSERTEARILYDDDTLYIGVICYDEAPELVSGRLGRRDRVPASDTVSVELDTTHDHRSGYLFQINAGGVLADGVLFDDVQLSQEWDGTWRGAAHRRSDGWSVELAIPLRLLRFSSAPAQTWGVAVRRYISRRHENIDSALMPRDAGRRVSLFGHLTGLTDLRPRRQVALTPYLAARATLQPQYTDPSRPTPRLLGPSLDVGLDVNAALTSDLTLTATINPDFGQVDADRLVLNFSNFEVFFPEKRPFFTQGMDIFQPVGVQGGRSPQMLFYSRRIGLEAPILGALKLSGAVAPGWEVGVVDAFVAGAADPTKSAAYRGGVPIDEDDPDRRLRVHPRQPLHLGPNYELPAVAPEPRNFLAAVTRGQLTPTLTVGASVAASTPLSRPCSELAPAERPDGASDCTPAGGAGVAADWNLRSGDGEWSFLGQVDASRVSGSAYTARTLADGTRLAPGDLGVGTYMRAGKISGEPWRFEFSYEYSSPRLELNHTGFQRTQNEQALGFGYSFVRTSGFGPLRAVDIGLSLSSRWSTDGRSVPRGTGAVLSGEAVFANFYTAACELGVDFMRNDVREIGATGAPFERPTYGSLTCFASTDESRALSLSAIAFIGRTFSSGVSPSKYGGGAEVGLTWSPHPRLETELFVTQDADIDGPRWIGAPSPERALFAELDSRTLSVTLRQILVAAPRLTLQAYAQLFTGYGYFGSMYEAETAGDRRVELTDLRPYVADGGDQVGDPSFHIAALNVNLVGRWEIRPGSTLYLVYSRAQQRGPSDPSARLSQPLAPDALLDGPVTDLLLLKLSHQFRP
ncbi:MAG: hypothetical protein Tsb0020_53470 [Haliangiales bacterium]